MIHKEGKNSLIIFGLMLLIGTILYSNDILPQLAIILLMIGAVFTLFFLQFFRNPQRNIDSINNDIYVPADGKVVVIEKVKESEYFKEEKLQVSIFMSPLNVHVNRSPFDGTVSYKKYHKGKFLMAFNPKSSIENERCTTVFKDKNGKEVLYRQVAGFLARRIVNYVDNGDEVIKGKDYGFIKLGSRVDIFLPVDTKLAVRLNQNVKGNIDKLTTNF